MAKIALIESKPSRNDYVKLFDNQFDFDQFQLCSDPTIKKVLKRDCDIDVNVDFGGIFAWAQNIWVLKVPELSVL